MLNDTKEYYDALKKLVFDGGGVVKMVLIRKRLYSLYFMLEVVIVYVHFTIVSDCMVNKLIKFFTTNLVYAYLNSIFITYK